MVNWPYTPCVLSKKVILGVCVCVCVCGELALHTLCPFKAGYTWCVCVCVCVCVVNWPYTPCVLSKQVILGVCMMTHLPSFG